MFQLRWGWMTKIWTRTFWLPLRGNWKARRIVIFLCKYGVRISFWNSGIQCTQVDLTEKCKSNFDNYYLLAPYLHSSLPPEKSQQETSIYWNMDLRNQIILCYAKVLQWWLFVYKKAFKRLYINNKLYQVIKPKADLFNNIFYILYSFLTSI